MDENAPVRDDMLAVTEYDLLSKLPDPFALDDGRRLDEADKWPVRRREILNTACAILYGQRPPEPEFLDVEALNDYRITYSYVYQVTTGTRERPITFRLKVLLPQETEGKCPVIVDGDDCFMRSPGYFEAALSRGIGWAIFDRTQIAHDVQKDGKSGAIYECFPTLDCGALSCWAWGYSRVVDALEKIDLPLDLSMIVFTGHSRGGKTALLAGAMDERAAVVNPNNAGAGGCGCYRLRVKGVYENDPEGRCEALRDSLEQFPYWYGPNAARYVDRENEMPFDLHFMKAAVAPRILFVSEAAGDLWANPVGSWQTTMAAREVYRFLGAGDRLFWYYRPGYHGHLAVDVEMLANVILHAKGGAPVDSKMFRAPFQEPPLAFDWRCPEK